MTQQEKGLLWQELKDAGVGLERHYREYSTEQLREAVGALRRSQQVHQAEEPLPFEEPVQEADSFHAPQLRTAPKTPSEKDTVAGLRLNQLDENEPLRVDENGVIWYQDEVRKPASAQPRGRRVYNYTDTGVKTVTVNGEAGATETFEMPGDQSIASQAKITLPSYQVGIYRDPRFPFKIHEYNGAKGFDYFEVNEFYGGEDLVPEDVKRIYVSSSLCYDMRTTIRAIQAEYRDKVLTKGIA